MSTLKAETARRNGAKSHGPVTAQGKAVSSLNAIKHGLNSKQVVLSHEDRSAYDRLHQSFRNRLRPIDDLEAQLVEKMAAATWRLNRITGIETEILEKEMLTRMEEMDQEFDVKKATPQQRLTWVWERLANETTTLTLLLRHQAQYNREFDKALKQLQDLQKQRRTQQEPEIRNEPKTQGPAPRSCSSVSICGQEKEPHPPSTPPSPPQNPDKEAAETRSGE